MFKDVLEKILATLDCPAKELAAASGLAPSVISRYRSGTRAPKPGSAQLYALATGLVKCAKARGYTEFTEERVLRELDASLAGEDSGELRLAFAKKLDALLTRLDIRNSDLARVLSFDASFLSKVRAGERHFADPAHCAEQTARYIVQNHSSPDQLRLVAELTGGAFAEDAGISARVKQLTDWLLSSTAVRRPDPVGRFLHTLDAFDLNQYLQAARFDRLTVPEPVQLPPTSRPYYGLREMMESELDFLQMTALSRSDDPVLFYSDMPMQEMSKDAAFIQKWLLGLATLLKKGLRFQVIHNVERPLAEMLMGLEAWIPLYMTGRIAPYYLNGVQNHVFLHFLRVSGAAAVEGSAIAGHQAAGRYYLTSRPEELANYRQRAKHLLKLAEPLMEIFRGDDPEAAAFLSETKDSPATVPVEGLPFRNIQIRVSPDKWAVVSKTNSPAMHFVIRHPKLVKAIGDFCR